LKERKEYMNRDYSILNDVKCKDEKPGLMPIKDPRHVGPIETKEGAPADRNVDKRTELEKEMTETQKKYHEEKNAKAQADNGTITEEPEEENAEPEEPLDPEVIEYPIAPKYKIVHSYPVELGQFWNDSEIHKVIRNKRPNELVMEIQLPLVESVADVNCDVKDKIVVLEYLDKYYMTVNLPYEVDSTNGKAKFERGRKVLKLNLPVVQKEYDESDFITMDKKLDREVEPIKEIAPIEEVETEVAVKEVPMEYDMSKWDAIVDPLFSQYAPMSNDPAQAEAALTEGLETIEGGNGIVELTDEPIETLVASDELIAEQAEQALEKNLLEFEGAQEGDIKLTRDAPTPEKKVGIQEIEHYTPMESQPASTWQPEIPKPKVVKVDLGFVESTEQEVFGRKVFMIKSIDYIKTNVSHFTDAQNFIIKYSDPGVKTFYFWVLTKNQGDSQLTFNLTFIKNYICITALVDTINFDEAQGISQLSNLEVVSQESRLQEIEAKIATISKTAQALEPEVEIQHEKPYRVIETEDSKVDAVDSDDEVEDEKAVIEEIVVGEVAEVQEEVAGMAGDAEPRRERFEANFMKFAVMQHVVDLDF
jgi:hypothetical protein